MSGRFKINITRFTDATRFIRPASVDCTEINISYGDVAFSRVIFVPLEANTGRE
jgi:hypothetical protein